MRKRPLLLVIFRFSIALMALSCCYKLIQDSASIGLSRLFSFSAIMQSSVPAAQKAASLTPNDPEAHYTLALELVNTDRLSEAVSELQRSIQLRPNHYYEWLDLGVTLDRLGDQEGASTALRESVRLAPFFAQPHWQLGNLLFRRGKYDEAFEELRLGATSNPNLMEEMLVLAWVAADENVATVENWIKPESGRNHLELARFLVWHGKVWDSARHAIEAGQPKDEGEVGILHWVTSGLINAREFSAAYSVWAASHQRNASMQPSEQFLNASFNEGVVRNDPGFGWQLEVVPNVSISIDTDGPTNGTRSVCVQFAGESPRFSQLIQQIILVRANTKYSLEFKARADNLVSGGPPIVVVIDASSEDRKILGQSNPLASSAGAWAAQRVDFSTNKNSSAVVVALQRLACKEGPCPIFGKLWLSGFALTRMEADTARRSG